MLDLLATLVQKTVNLADHHDPGELAVIWAYRLVPGGLLGWAIIARKQLKGWVVKIVTETTKKQKGGGSDAGS